MADCYALEAEDLHRRWLPREIFADIGIVDPDPVAAATAADAEPEAAAAVAAVEELAVQLVGMIGAGAGSGGREKPDPAPRFPFPSPPPPPPPPPDFVAAPAPCHRAPVCGLERAVFVTYGGASVVWPVTPYSPVQWQVASTFMDYPTLPSPAPRLVPPPPPPPPQDAKPRGGTGVFLPRADAYRHATHPAAKEGKGPPGSRTWVERLAQQPQKEGEAAAAGRSQNGKLQKAVALPKEWSYSH